MGAAEARPADRGADQAVAAAHARLATGDLPGALVECQQLLRRFPGSPDVWNLVGLCRAAAGEPSSALRFYGQALALDPGFVEAHNNLGSALCGMGRAADALTAFAQARRLRPEDRAAADNLLLAGLCVAELTPEELASLHLAWGQDLESAVIPLAPRRPARDRRLRVGYVSADFRRHAVSTFLGPILAHHDRDAFEIHAYANLRGPGDAITARLRGLVDHWHPIAERSDAEVARQIAADGIDLLVDLAGHTAGHRLGVFALRPAPVQATYLGYPATTGLTRVDYRLTDALADPPGKTEALHSERLLRLPLGFHSFEAPGPAPTSTSAPRPPGAPFTFGSFNDTSKLSPQVLSLWGRIVAATPGARLLLKARGLGDAGVRQHLLTGLAAGGLGPERIDFLPFAASREEHLASYQRVDLALDSFPYHGTTTTCEALWAGVPVVSRAGRAHVSRVGASLLGQVGLAELVTESDQSDDSYVALASALAADPDRLLRLRAELPGRLARSPLLDAAGFARRLEASYREMVETAREGGGGAGHPPPGSGR